MLGKSACAVACEVAKRAGLGLVLGKEAGWGAWKKCSELLMQKEGGGAFEKGALVTGRSKEASLKTLMMTHHLRREAA